MLKHTFNLVMLCISLNINAQVKMPAISPNVEISQTIGISKITLNYSRPSLRERQLFGDKGILEVGQKWRTGANAVTKIELTHDIEIGNNKLPKGAYTLLSTPGRSNWMFHFYPHEKGSYTKYLSKDPMLTITSPTLQTKETMESLNLYFDQVGLDEAALVLHWENYKVKLPVKIDQHDQIMQSINAKINGPSDFFYFQAALYLHEKQIDLPVALSYIQRVTKEDNALFFQVHREALILKDLNRNDEALIAAKRSALLSQKAGNDDFVRLSNQIIEELSKE